MDFFFIDLDYDNQGYLISDELLKMTSTDHWVPIWMDGSPVHPLRAQVMVF